jgi:hypothetical protein
MRVIAVFFCPRAPDLLTWCMSYSSHYFNRLERLTKLATSSNIGRRQSYMPILLKCGTRGRTLDRDELKSRQASPKKERVAFYLSEDLADEIRNAVVHFSGPPLRLTMTSVAEMAFQKELERLKAEHNGGKPFPKRDEDLKGGRPIR